VQACPYGVTCRWASQHTDASGDQARAVLMAQESGGGGRGAEGSAGASTAAAAANEELDAVAAAAGTSCSPLPALRSVDQPVNALDKEVQRRLWKGQYNFERADAVLRALGVDPGSGRSRQDQRGGRGGGRGGGGGGTGGGGRGGGGRGGQQQEQQQQQQAEGAHQGAGSDERPSAKRPKVDVADVSLNDLYAAAATTAEQQPTQQVDAAAAPLTSAQQAEAPAAAGTDAAAVAALAATITIVPPAAAAAAAEAGDYVEVPVHARERRKLDLSGKTYLAPLTTVGTDDG